MTAKGEIYRFITLDQALGAITQYNVFQLILNENVDY